MMTLFVPPRLRSETDPFPRAIDRAMSAQSNHACIQHNVENAISKDHTSPSNAVHLYQRPPSLSGISNTDVSIIYVQTVADARSLASFQRIMTALPAPATRSPPLAFQQRARESPQAHHPAHSGFSFGRRGSAT